MSEAVTNTSLLGWLDRQDWAGLLEPRHQLCSSWLPLNHLDYQAGCSTLIGPGLSRLCSHWLDLDVPDSSSLMQ